MSKYHKCPECGKPAPEKPLTIGREAYLMSDWLRFVCETCRTVFFRKPGGLG